MEDYFESFSEDIKKWDLIKNMTDLDIGEGRRKDHKTAHSVQLLPRRDVMLYGTIPKMEQRIYTKCKECRLLFNPRDILSHKACPRKSHSSTSHSLKKKVKSKGSTAKKSHSNLPPPPLSKKSPSPNLATATVSIPDMTFAKVPSPKISKISAITTSTTLTTSSSSSKSELRVSSGTSSKTNSHSPRSPSITSSNSEHSPKSKQLATPSSESNCSSTSSSSSRHKKSRKTNSTSSSSNSNTNNSNTKITIILQCGVVEGNKGPCTRSLTCNNHPAQFKKLVNNRNKEIQQLLAERKTVKEKEPKHGSNCSYTSPNGQPEEVNDSFSHNTIFAPGVGALSSASEPLETSSIENSVLHKISEPKPMNPVRQTTSVVAGKQSILTDTENGNTKTMNNNYIKNLHVKESELAGLPLVYMPLSPISIVQIGKNMICLKTPPHIQTQSTPVASQALFLPIPNHSNTKIYKCINPKPAAVPNYGAKKVGGAILLSNQRIECQRNDILMAINKINNTQGYRTISLLNHTNTPHRPNILKVKSANKVNCKRSSVDKLSTCDSKQMRLTKLVGSFCSPI